MSDPRKSLFEQFQSFAGEFGRIQREACSVAASLRKAQGAGGADSLVYR
jgi:hypothetical protein